MTLAQIDRMTEALEWYAKHCADMRKHGQEGIYARARLDRDAGFTAQTALGHFDDRRDAAMEQ